jgi:hypothetical protein
MMPATALPEAARQKLSALRVQQMNAEDAARGCWQRISSLPPRDTDRELLDRLTAARNRANEQHRTLSLLINKLHQFLAQMPPTAALEIVPPADFKLRNGETLSTAIEATRNGIKSLQGQLQVIRRAPLPLSDREKCAEQYVQRLADRARPMVGFDTGDQLTLRWTDDIVASRDDALGLLAWAAPEAVLSALMNQIRQMPTPVSCLSPQDRTARVAELEQKQLELERAEEAMIMRAAGDGIELLRRPDASPLAVLGLTVAAKASAAQVA